MMSNDILTNVGVLFVALAIVDRVYLYAMRKLEITKAAAFFTRREDQDEDEGKRPRIVSGR